MPNYIKKAKNAKRMIDKSGRLVKLVKVSQTPSDPLKPWKTSTSNDQFFNSICLFMNFEFKEVDGDIVKNGDQKLLVNAIDNNGADLENYTFVQDGDISWRIVNVYPYKFGDTVVLYEIQVRK